MSDDTLAPELEELKDTYGDVSTAGGASQQTLIRIGGARLPYGCVPISTSVLLVVQDGQRPQCYVKGAIKLPSGSSPRNYAPVQMAGEEWWQFSYAFPWEQHAHSLVQFVEASLQRFAKTE